MSGIQAADGTTNVTVVDGSVYTGYFAADGSVNVVQVDGTDLVGLQHPCGASNVFLSTGDAGYYHPCGAWNVSQTGAYIEGTQKVTVVAGVLA